MRWRKGRIVVVLLAVVAGLALAGRAARHPRANECALDGAAINPLYRVRVVDEQGRSQVFCCLRCADLWLAAREQRPRAIFVTDEASGKEIDMAQAFFVRSVVVTNETTGNALHAFRDHKDAERHAAAAHGTILSDAERPLAVP